MNAVANIQAARLPYHPAIETRFGVDQGAWRVLTDAVFPAAERPESIIMALAYCKARNLDIFKKPVQIVPIYDKKRGGMVDTVWPGISELRTTAMRTRDFAGFDQTEFGPDKDDTLGGVEVTYPTWAQCTLYRLVAGQRVAFVGPKVYWIETYATAKRDTKAPNSMWAKRPRGQLEKCAEAAALRRAFPEEIGNEYAAEEIEGQAFGAARDAALSGGSGVAARLAGPGEGGGEGFSAVQASGGFGAAVDDIPHEFGGPAPEGSSDASAPPTDGAEPSPGAADDDFPGDRKAPTEEPKVEPEPVDLVAWAQKLTDDLPGLTLEQIEQLLENPTDREIFAELEAAQPQLALDLNRAITRRRRELSQ